MKNNLNTFRPEIKDVKKGNLIDNTYHILENRIDKREKRCEKIINIYDYRITNIK